MNVLPRIPTTSAPGRVQLAFCRAGEKTVLGEAFATSPARLLAPRNHGEAAWVFLASLGGGLLEGDRLDVKIDVAAGAFAMVGTQASTKVYRSPKGCSQRLDATVGSGAALVLLPDPVVCFAGAKYAQANRITLGADASLLLLDGYTCGRSARGERWEFSGYQSKLTVLRPGSRTIADAVRLDATPGPLRERMGRYDVIVTFLAIGPRFAEVRAAMGNLARAPLTPACVVAVSPIDESATLVRIAAERFENAALALRNSFAVTARALGDDPFARKW